MLFTISNVTSRKYTDFKLHSIVMDKSQFYPVDHYLVEVGWLACSTDLKGYTGWSFISW